MRLIVCVRAWLGLESQRAGGLEPNSSELNYVSIVMQCGLHTCICIYIPVRDGSRYLALAVLNLHGCLSIGVGRLQFIYYSYECVCSG